jgi:hypothetical protein
MQSDRMLQRAEHKKEDFFFNFASTYIQKGAQKCMMAGTHPYKGLMLQGKYARETRNCDVEGDSFMTSFIW